MKNPKEESKQESPMQKLIDIMKADKELRHEEERENNGSYINVFKVEKTLEEAFENWLYDLENTNPLVIEKGYPWIPMKFGFIEGAKYKQENSYSEEEVKEIIKLSCEEGMLIQRTINDIVNIPYTRIDNFTIRIIQQFKNK